MDHTFTSPLMYWVGIDTDGASEAQLAEFNAFYSDVHLPEVVAGNQGFVRAHRYELARPDPRGDLGPRWLGVHEMADENAAAAYLAENAGSPTQRPSYTPLPDVWRAITKIRWRIIWRQIAEAGRLEEPPYSIFLVGIDPPGGTDDAAIAEFNAFYTDTHLPEVVAAARFGRGTRYERVQGPDPPRAGMPPVPRQLRGGQDGRQGTRGQTPCVCRADPGAPGLAAARNTLAPRLQPNSLLLSVGRDQRGQGPLRPQPGAGDDWYLLRKRTAGIEKRG